MNSRITLLPVGFKFRPTDEELVNYYLFGKINGDSIIQDAKIKDIDIYEYEPMELYDPNFDHGNGRMYFFTPLHKIHPNGQRVKRDTKEGFWRATQKSTDVLDQSGNIIGTKMPLAYYSKSQNSTPKKTSWLMSEYRLPKGNTPSTQCHDPSILERITLCVVYYNERSKKSDNNESHQNEVPKLVESDPPFIPISSSVPYSYPNLSNNLIVSSSIPISNYYQTFDGSFLNPILISPLNTFSNPNLNSYHVSTSNLSPSPKRRCIGMNYVSNSNLL